MSVFGDDEPFKNELAHEIEKRVLEVGFVQAMLEVHQVLAYIAEYVPHHPQFKEQKNV